MLGVGLLPIAVDAHSPLEWYMLAGTPDCVLLNGFHPLAEGVENIILAEGVSKTNEEIQPWRMAISKILSKGTIMQLQLPLMVQEFTDTIRRCGPEQKTVRAMYM